MSLRALCRVCIFILFIGLGSAADVPYVFGENPYEAGYTSSQLELISASSPDLVGVPPISTTAYATEYRKDIFNARVEPENPTVHDTALSFAGDNDGTLTIDQICSIYQHLKNGDSSTNGWIYKFDPRGTGDYLAYANETLLIGREIGSTGTGDCDDFAIAMSALMESIGGTTRIITACDDDSCHAYTEIYLGQLNDPDNHVKEVINWLRQKFDIDKIYTHIDTTTWAVWLNLDWSAGNPGGSFFTGDSEEVIWIKEWYEKTSVEGSIPNPQAVEVDTNIEWNNDPELNSEAPPIITTVMILISQGNYEEAMLTCDRAIELDQYNMMAWSGKVIVLLRQGNYDEAMRTCNEAIELQPQNDTIWEVKSVIYITQGKLEEALQACNRAIELNPQGVEAWMNKAAILSEQKNYDNAIYAYDRIIELDPQNSNAWIGRGDALFWQGKFDESIQSYDKAIELDPQNAGVWNSKAISLRFLNRTREANEAFSRAKELCPTCGYGM